MEDTDLREQLLEPMKKQVEAWKSNADSGRSRETDYLPGFRGRRGGRPQALDAADP